MVSVSTTTSSVEYNLAFAHLSFLPPPPLVSGEVPEEPVLSPLSKHVFEKRLAVKFIEENGTDPVTGEAMAVEDLVEIKGETKPHATAAAKVKCTRRFGRCAVVSGLVLRGK